MLETMKAHPVITALCVICAIGGAVMGPFFTPEGWSLTRQIAAGTVAGMGCALIVAATRITGAFAPDIEDDGREPRD